MSQILLAAYGTPAGPFTPTDIAGLKLWLVAEGQSYSDGDPVGTWVDASGTSNDATATGTDRPTFKTAIVNGLSVVRFTAASSNRLAFTSPAGTTHTFIVGAINVAPASLSIFTPFIIYGNSDNGRLCARLNSTTNWGTFLSSIAELSASEDLVSGTFNYLEMSSSAAGGTNLYRNGTLKASDGNSSANGASPFIGAEPAASRFLDGDIAEIITYDSVLSGPDRASVEGYLAAKYSL